MSEAGLAGRVQTVLGPIDPSRLGRTSSHEHILSTMSAYFSQPLADWEQELVDQPLSLQNMGWARSHRFSNRDNMSLDDRALAVSEVNRFREAGGGSIVEMSPIGMGRDPHGLAHVARATGVNIVMGSGYYLGISHPPDMDRRTVDDIADEIVNDIVDGVPGPDGTKVKAGLIGELGCSVPLSANEEKVLRAAALAQRRTGAPLDVHPSFSDELVLRIVGILADAGAMLDHIMISHVENFEYTLQTRLALLEAGCFLGYDNFGNLGYPHSYLGRIINLTTDYHRIGDMKELIARGYLGQLLVGQDICFKDMLAANGGYGYTHLLRNAMPLMRDMQLTEDQIDALVIDNPRRFLTFREPVA